MPISKQVRLLQNKWQSETGWPKYLESVQISGLRGWIGQTVPLRFPLIAICGENGSGKSTILQAAAASYRPQSDEKGHFASDFLPNTPWDEIKDAFITARVREGNDTSTTTIKKLTERWRGYQNRKKRRVEYIDLRRVSPVTARVGYTRIAKSTVTEVDSVSVDFAVVSQFADIMGRPYGSAKLALTDADPNRRVSVVKLSGSSMSGFHQGAGELLVGELLDINPPDYSLVLIDEIEASLHPRAQRRLIRYLAELCRKRGLQIVLTTHSPYILSELPPEARAYIFQGNSHQRQVIFGVSPEFAMSRMDEEPHPECDLYVEDFRAECLLREILVAKTREQVQRCQFIPYGAANVGHALGQMVAHNHFPRRSLVFVDGDQPDVPGCIRLPGDDAPERVVFEALKERNWGSLHERTGRSFSYMADSCSRAMLSGNHHEWVQQAAERLLLSGHLLWSLMCIEWVSCCLTKEQAGPIVEALTEVLSLPYSPEPFPNEPMPPYEPHRSAVQDSEQQHELFLP